MYNANYIIFWIFLRKLEKRSYIYIRYHIRHIVKMREKKTIMIVSRTRLVDVYSKLHSANQLCGSCTRTPKR